MHINKTVVLANVGLNILAAAFIAGVVFYPFVWSKLSDGFLFLVLLWGGLTISGGVFFYFKIQLGIAYILWANVIILFSMTASFYIFYILSSNEGRYYFLTIYGLLVALCFMVFNFYFRMKEGGVEKALMAGRVELGTYKFFPGNHVPLGDGDLRVSSRWPMIIASFGGCFGLLIHNFNLILNTIIICMFLSGACFSWFFSRILFPDFVTCLYCGIKKKNK
ncbi:hypothetical protein EZV61_17320 [Corallincola luteus]|uniref:Uncharacterized protein n=1 Tax=Corallincola luteus TaxID=1775177 RepID=A0ABY2AH89_9GAMM|nr:hypothetical protein [Corallincola luteus]TCI01730.1 hypothetical protein EZV61_17320 [Corallincola luteus]